MADNDARPGERALGFDPASRAEAGVTFIGHLVTPWRKGDCPRNLTEARARGGLFQAVVDPAYRAGLEGLAAGDPVILLYWMAGARRDLIVQAPAHRPSPRGVFALRSPARPNPVALACVTLRDIDAAAGLLTVDALDAFDGTPLLDIKPWIPAVDNPAAASTAPAA
jgi:tRNA-Thr(GGU) m(6)t(6)A37 methyltransferase TsaA